MMFMKSLSRGAAQFFLLAFGFKASRLLCHLPVSLIHGQVLRKKIFPPWRGLVPLRRRILLGGASLLFLFPQSAFPAVSLSLFVSGLSSPVYLTHAGDFSGRIFVVEKEGRIRIIKNGVLQVTPFLDITARVLSDGERGLLSVAFPPNYVNKGYFYVYYTNLSGNNKIARFSITADPDVANANSELTILTVNHPGESNHNGGQLAFGPDGYLYVGTGDGGGGGDPNNNAQTKTSLLGKILRLDVEGSSNPYIPASNPFVGGSALDDTVWAYGLRNPWRFSFDRQTGDLYIGDVGQGDYEEIDFQAAGIAGGQNYGWRIWEGLHCFNPSSGCASILTTPPYVPPVFEYNHDQGDCSLTGGFVYRGQIYPNMQGTYFYADFCTGKLWGLKKVGNNWQSTFIVDSPQLVSSFGQDQEGNIYLLDLSTGEVFKIVESTVNPAVSLSVNPTKRIITGGTSATYAVSITRTSFAGNVDLNVSGLPAAASGNFSPDPTTGNTSTLTLDTSLTNTPAGNYTVTIGAAGSEVTIDPITVSLTINIPDSDSDRLNNQQEAQLGTNPNDPDSDHDTYNDGQEVGAGTNPLSGSSFPGTLKITADNQYVLYVNGVQVGTNSSWPDVESYLVNTDDELNIAVDATDAGGIAALACQVTHGSDKHASDFTWQVSNTLMTNWQNDLADHSTWVNATEHFSMGQGPWGNTVTNQFTSGVKWIWSSDASNHNKVYFWTKYNPGQNAVIKATADNILEIYNDEGDLIGQGNDWQKVIYVPEKIEAGNAIGIHGQDIVGAGGVGGILAEILYRDSQGNIQRLVTDTNWKYSTSLVSGWTDDDFDDSAWFFAVDNGQRGVGPWGNAGTVGNISNLAHWVWSTHNGDQTDDNNIWIRKIIPNATLNLSCDNQCTVYVNGNPKGSLSDWSSPKSIGLNLSNGDVVAIQGTDLGGLAGVLASLSYNNSTILTNSSWKVTNQSQPDLDWTTEGFDDSGWTAAESYGSNGVLPWGTLGSISNQAQWIWSADRYNDDTVYFRCIVGQSNNATGLTTLRISGDDSYKLYFNGEFLATGNNFKQSKEIQLELASNDVIAVEGNDGGTIKAGLLMQTIGAFTLNTNTTWKRLATSSAPANWNTQGFNDSAWLNANSYGTYPTGPWGTVAGITTPTTAQWIWSSRNTANAIDKKVLFRKRIP